MNKEPFLRLSLLVLLVAAILSGALQGGPAPVLAVDCPDSYPVGCQSSGVCAGTCSRVSIDCDEVGCCCRYISYDWGGTCPDYCDF